MSASQIDLFRALAQYNHRFNRQLYGHVATLSPENRTKNMGAFFGSIHETLHHILVADRIWLGRFRDCGMDFPSLEEADLTYGIAADSATSELAIFADLERERVTTDQLIMSWVEDLTAEVLAAPLRYTNSKGITREHPLWIAVAHLFNHQTHHRGQVTTLMMQLGCDPGVTDFVSFVSR